MGKKKCKHDSPVGRGSDAADIIEFSAARCQEELRIPVSNTPPVSSFTVREFDFRTVGGFLGESLSTDIPGNNESFRQKFGITKGKRSGEIK